ncbi:hypothetical protein [Pectinatus frisingensis]|uniref:hypothetical protein n=1 Tax=Pectinatus frisingensis TaxID=865 RepID=UPI0018C54A3C|nr:hypothetical protein [Pectinatus frisingensis]
MKALIGKYVFKIIIMLIKAAGSCLTAFLLKERGNLKMTNTTTTSLLAALAQIGLAVGTSYLSAKVSNKNTGWVSGGYRDQLINSTLTAVLTTVAQQVADAQTTNTTDNVAK